MTESHHLLESWLIDGAVGDPPRELAVHAAVCDSCARRLGAFDSLAVVDVAAAGSPPPVAAPTRLGVGLAWARMGTAVLGTVVAGVIVVFAASQLVGFVGSLPAPSDGVALETDGRGSGEPGSFGPEPAGEPSIPAPTPVPEATFIALPTAVPGAATIPAPAAPNLSVRSVATTSVTLAWTQPGGGGPPFKYELWRATGSGGFAKIAELPGFRRDVTNTGLQPGQLYRFRVRAVSGSGLGTYSNTVSATTTVGPTPPPSVGPTPSPTPTPECSDGIDNDSDGWIDFGGVEPDPECTSPLGNSEAPANPRQCNDGVDNDGDGWIDFGGVEPDPECTSPLGNSEAPANPRQCNDGVDNDGDHLIDDGGDPSCSGFLDDSEGPFDATECNDTMDNEGVPDGLKDFGEDPECLSWSDNSEEFP